MTRPLPRARWIAVEQSRLQGLRRTLELLEEGAIGLENALELAEVYGQHCAERAHELGRRAAEHRARLRARRRNDDGAEVPA